MTLAFYFTMRHYGSRLVQFSLCPCQSCTTVTHAHWALMVVRLNRCDSEIWDMRSSNWHKSVQMSISEHNLVWVQLFSNESKWVKRVKMGHHGSKQIKANEKRKHFIELLHWGLGSFCPSQCSVNFHSKWVQQEILKHLNPISIIPSPFSEIMLQ